MKFNSRTASVAAIAVVLVAASCKKKDAGMPDTTAMAAPSAMPAAQVAVHVTDVSVGKGLSADKNLMTPTGDFGVRDTVYAVVKTDGAATSAKLDAKWTYNGKQTVNESSQNISPTGGENRAEFHIQKASAWPKGNYKVEVMLDGSPAGSKEFTVK